MSVLIQNANIYQANSVGPLKRDLLIDNFGKIKAVEKQIFLTGIKSSFSRIIDMKGRVLLPGLIESHGHFLGTGKKEIYLDLEETKSPKEIKDRLLSYEKKLPYCKKEEMNASWIIGRGYDENNWSQSIREGFHYRKFLDEIIPHRPIYLTRVDGHGAWVNSCALEKGKIGSSSWNRPGGRILLDKEGNPNGLLIDLAMELILKILPKTPQEDQEKAFYLMQEKCLDHGITSFHDAGTSEEDLLFFLKMAKEKKIKVSLNLMGLSLDLCQRYASEVDKYSHWLKLRSVKLFADGALGSCGALLERPYKNKPEECGLELLSKSELIATCKKALELNLQVCTHAIGDQANYNVLQAYDEVLGALPYEERLKRRWRVEHAQILNPDHLHLFKKNGIIASMQPLHFTSDFSWAKKFLGKKRLSERGYLWKSILVNEISLCFGSDTPIESLCPFKGFAAAMERVGHESLDFEETLEAYTRKAAYASFSEGSEGAFGIGMWANFLLLKDGELNLLLKKQKKEKIIDNICIRGEIKS